MFKRKLSALGYELNDNFDINDMNQMRVLISWLEDQKIRHYKIEDRDNLRDFTDDQKWQIAFETYLKDIECPFDSNSNVKALDWVLSYAARLEYRDNLDKYANVTAENVKRAAIEPQMTQKNPIDHLDFDSDEFKDGIEHLAKMLKVPQYNDHLITLKAIRIVIQKHIENEEKRKEAIKKPKLMEEKSIVSENRFTMENTPLGFDTGDKVLNNAAKVIRLLFINDLRELQTKVNEMIVASQSITANPKTDTSLGKVGK